MIKSLIRRIHKGRATVTSPAILIYTLVFFSLFMSKMIPASAGVTIDGVVCTVNGMPILRSEVIEWIGKRNPSAEDQEKWDQACHELAIQKILEKIATDKGITASDEEVEQLLTKRLKEVGIKKEDVREELPRYRLEMRRFLIKQRVVNQALYNKVVITPADVREYYDSHPDEFRIEEKRKIRMISVIVSKDADAEARKKAREKIAGILKQLKEGADFARLARRDSNDPYAEQGGDWGIKKKGDLIPSIDKVAFSLEVGQISDVVQSPQGFHLVKIEQRQPESVKPFSEVKDSIRENLERNQFSKKYNEYIEELLKDADIHCYDKGPGKK